jgi:hypothetical protein
MSTPLQKEATALWLIENTKLTFKQISDFCKLHSLEIEKLADGDIKDIFKKLEPDIGGTDTKSLDITNMNTYIKLL